MQHRCKCTHCAMISVFVFLSRLFSLSLHLCLYLSLSDKLGDSLFCRKCSPHTDCRLVCSRFNLIIASPAFNQPASVCFMLKLCYKYKIDFDTRCLAKLSQKSSTETQDEMEFFLTKILYLCFQSLLQGCKKVKGKICFVFGRLWASRQRITEGSPAASATCKDWHISICIHGGALTAPLFSWKTHAQIHT